MPARLASHVIGTAGHVDHGKSSLVAALTGTNPDRWLEEQLRGMTLDLGFARLRFDDGVDAGIVDVPGHERFLHNMLAGAAGMELLLLVIAANEGPRRQTLEHLAILRYLNVRRSIVALTKCDLLDADELEIARELAADGLEGTLAAGAPIIAVSSVTGEGLDALRAAIHDALVALPPRASDAPAYLPIDRVFVLAGHGTIVTGTLMQGRISVGDFLQLAPLGERVRVRSLQVFGEKREQVEGGTRVAVNIPGIERSQLARGAVLASEQFRSASTFDVRFAALDSARGMFRRRTPVRAYIGAAEIVGTLVFQTPPESATSVPARLHLRTPTIAFPGANFVVRRLSPKDLLGGGTVAHLSSGDEDRPIDDESAGDLLTVALTGALREAGLDGAPLAALGAAANVREDVVRDIVGRLAAGGRVFALTKPPAFVDAGLADALFGRIDAALGNHHQTAPWMAGMTSLALARALGIAEGTLVRLLALFAEDGRVVHHAGYIARPDFKPALSAEQLTFFERALAGETSQPLAPRPLADVTAAIRVSRITGLAQAFDTLIVTGAAVKIGDEIYRGTQIAQIRARLEAALRREGSITMAGFRDIVGTSRKYAVPLLEWFDVTGVTVRSGDLRMLREPLSHAVGGGRADR